MKKFALVAVVFSMFAGVVGCGSSPCDDYAAKAKTCLCDPLTDATAKTACEKGVDDGLANFKASAGADDACQAGLDVLKANPACK